VNAFRVVVLGEGKDESGNRPRTTPPFEPIPHAEQGAMEILVRRALYPILNNGAPWHRGLAANDGIQILQPPSPRRPSAVEVLANAKLLAPIVLASLRPPGKRPPADVLVASHDSDAGLAAVVKAIDIVNTALSTGVPLIAPVPEVQAWLTSKRSIEQSYNREHCTVEEPNQELLRVDAKAELKRLLSAFGGRFDAKAQARLAFWVSDDDLKKFDWTGWSTVDGLLRAAVNSEQAARSTRAH
jgi:hypothetical protein